MALRQNSFVEAYNYIKEQDSIRENKIKAKINESIEKHKSILDNINNIRDNREARLVARSRILEDCKNDALGTVIKAIYIEALEPESLTDNGIILAESLVDSWIRSKGGASRVIVQNRNKTYLLNRICKIAEEAAFKEAEEIQNIENEDQGAEQSEAKPQVTEEEKRAKVSELMSQAQALIAKANAIQNGQNVVDDAPAEEPADADTTTDAGSEEGSGDSVSAEELSSDDSVEEDGGEDNKEESSEEESEPESSEEEEPEEDDDDEDDTSDSSDEFDDGDFRGDDDEEESEEDEESDEEEPEEDSEGEDDEEEEEIDMDDDVASQTDDIEDDGNEDGSDITGEDVEDSSEPKTVNGEPDEDGNSPAKAQLFEELEDEEDVKKAVNLISQRVADAEEDFIKRNAEDKKKIDDIISKISDNIKTVENIADENDPKSKIAEESVRMYNRQIKNITESRPQTVFEKIVRKLTESSVKDTVLREAYTTESGQLDMGGIIESAKVMYGFLETLATMQLERVDRIYIEDVIKEL